MLKCPLPALFTWETQQKKTLCSPPAHFSKLQPLILCKFIYSKQQHKQFFFLGSAAYWININHQRRQGWKEDGSPFSQDWFFFFFKPKHTGISRKLFTIEKVQLKSHSQKRGTRETDQVPWNLKEFFFNHLKFLFWWPLRVWLYHYRKPTWTAENKGRGGSKGEK